MKWSSIVKDYLSFTRKERIGIVTILSLITVVILLPRILSYHEGNNFQKPDTSWVAAIRQLEQNNTAIKKPGPGEIEGNEGFDPYANAISSSTNNHESQLFYFDPNTASKEEWKKLGLRDKTIQTIQNYLGKGGHFKKPEDLQRVYGLKKSDYERLAPYVKIQLRSGEADHQPVETSHPAADRTGFKKMTYSSVDINIADTSVLIDLPGIGSKLAARIIHFRDKLGGFYKIEQIGETFGLADSTFQKIKPYLVLKTTSVKKMDVNKVTVDELKIHPYLRYNIANAIVAYRNQHGPFSIPEDLKKVMLVTDDVYQKISPYLTLSQ